MGLRVHNDTFTDLKLWQAPLFNVPSSATTVEQQAKTRAPNAPVNLG